MKRLLQFALLLCSVSLARGQVTVTGSTIITGSGGAGAGVTSLNGATGALTLVPGTGNVNFSVIGQQIALSVSGSAGSGAVLFGGPYNDANYTQSSAASTVGPLSNRFTLPVGLSAAQIAGVFSAVSASTITLQNGDYSHFNAWTNTTNTVDDQRSDIPLLGWNVKQSGAQCDLAQDIGTVTLGSPTLTVTSGPYVFAASDAGDPSTHAGAKWIEMVGLVAGVPTRFDAQIIAFVSSTQVTLAANAPFSVTNYSVTIAHDDTAAIASAFALWRGSPDMEIKFPAHGYCWSDTVALEGQSFSGQGMSASALVTKAGRDAFAADDPSSPPAGGFYPNQANQHLANMTIGLDARIDNTKPWSINTNGTTVAQPLTYRPWGQLTYLANNPLGYGWIQSAPLTSAASPFPSAQNGVAGVGSSGGGSSTSVICVPTGITPPAVGAQIMFPYQTLGVPVFATTVASYAGTCSSGQPVTLAAAYTPATSAQAEWFAGTSIQNIQTSIPSSGRTFPMTVTLANTIIPTQVSHAYPNSDTYDSNVATFGLVQIDAEQCTYFGTSALPASPPPNVATITLTACAQNGTAAAAHSPGALIVPLNPYHPTWPWPVFNAAGVSPNGATSTPATAEYFPGPSAGATALSFANSNGVSYNGTEALFEAHVHDLVITSYPFIGNAGENATGFQEQNSTACFYAVALPFNSHFDNIKCVNAQQGFIEGTPATNQNNYFADFPTADGNTWHEITIHSACFPFDFIGGGSNIYDGFAVWSQCGGEVANSNWPSSPQYAGAGTGWMWGGSYSDVNSYGGSGSKYLTMNNFYFEGENGIIADTIPIFRFGCATICHWDLGGPQAGGAGYIFGLNNTFGGSLPNQGPAIPIINFGTNTNFDNFAGIGQGYMSNVYGAAAYLNWGPGGHCSATANGGDAGGIGPLANCAVGGEVPVWGQTAHMFEVGNDTAGSEISADSAMIYPYEFNTDPDFEVAPAFDVRRDETAPWTHASVSCNVTTAGGCFSWQFNSGARKYIGPDQPIAAEKMILHAAFETPAGANTFNLQLQAISPGAGSGCTPSTPYSTTVTTTATTWQKFSSGATPIDFSASSGCVLQVVLQNSGSNTVVKTAGIFLAPYWTTIQVGTANVATVNVGGLATGSGDCVQIGAGGLLTDSGAPCGTGSGGISSLTGDVTASGTGAVAATVNSINGGTPFTAQASGPECNTTGIGQLFPCTNISVAGFGSFAGALYSAVYTVPSGVTPVFDASQGNTQSLTLTVNSTSSTLVNANAGQELNFEITPAGFTFAWPSNFVGFPAVTTGATGYTFARGVFDGTNVVADGYNSAFCISAASPAACGGAYRGYVAVPTGTNPTLVVDTTAASASSAFILTPDQSLGTALSVTCNTATVPTNQTVTARTPGTSFTFEAVGTFSTNPVCYSYVVVNP